MPETTPPKLRVAVIGCGAIGTRHARALGLSADADLTAVCDTDADRAEAHVRGTSARAYQSVEELLRQEALDAVTVATPDHLHTEPVLAALAAGRHVFCEKPLATTLEDALLMVTAAAQHRVHLAVDYNRRFSFGYRKAQELVAAGRIGKITHALIRVTDGVPASMVNRGPYALLYTLMSHHIDLLRHFGGEIVSVHAYFGPPDPAGNFWDVSLTAQLEGGAVGSMIGGWRRGQTRTVELTDLGGTGGFLQVEDVLRKVRLHAPDPDHVEEFQPSTFGQHTAFYDSLTDHLCSFVERVRRGEPPLVTGRDGVRGLEIIQAAIESHRTGAAVQV
jgi:UDP-N-acetylglucosamine 3-dehydrogenase